MRIVFFSQLFNKNGKAFIGILLKIVFMAEIKIISQPFHIILMHGRM